ncbi:hypothetical protein E2C01_054690 [Portunus trituberculatus]|uniref:Uncharacterized protein n=1 Tax=Portunus trituberculatus TaxID=210409 RepID=A0A5B7GSP5_PORTR|nr:hypothetical protein [Portunus trituberculatus]
MMHLTSYSGRTAHYVAAAVVLVSHVTGHGLKNDCLALCIQKKNNNNKNKKNKMTNEKKKNSNISTQVDNPHLKPAIARCLGISFVIRSSFQLNTTHNIHASV